MNGANWFEQWLAPAVGYAQKMAHFLEKAPAFMPSALFFAALGTAAAIVGAAVGYKIFMNKRIPQLKKNADTTPVGGARDWTFFFDYIHNIVIKVFNFLALVTDMVIDKFVQILQWMVCSLVFIVGDGLRSLQVRNVRLQVALSIAGVAVIGIVVYLCGGLS